MHVHIRYCPECKNDSSEVIAAGEKLRYSKKKSSMMSKKNECNRDWGKVGAYNTLTPLSPHANYLTLSQLHPRATCH